MRGRNTLILNTATVMQAIQEYLLERMNTDIPIVVGFTAERAESGVGFVYRVDLDERADGAGRTTP